jgi:threonine-phosphate decarboxylase
MRKIPCPWTDPTPLFRHGDAWGRVQPELIDFSVSVNPLGPPAGVLHALRIPQIDRYPDPDSLQLRETLAARHGLEPDQIVAGNGANDLIYAAARAFRPGRVAILEPTYTEYFRASLRVGASVDHWLAEAPGFEPQQFDPDGVDLVWLANPNNPTGRLWDKGQLLGWIGSNPRIMFLVDEAFLPFRADGQAQSLISALAQLPNLVVVRSLTKVFAMPGMRLGYALACGSLAARLREEVVPWSVNSLAQAAGIAALQDSAYLVKTQTWFEEEAQSFEERLGAFSPAIAPVPSQANFVLVKLEGTSAARLSRGLMEYGVTVRPAGNFVGLDDRYLRISARTTGENLRFLHALRTALEEL